MLMFSPALGQTSKAVPLRLGGLAPGGLRATVTDHFVPLDFEVTNFGDQDRQARVFVFQEGHSDVQYGREVWVPAAATVQTSLLFKPSSPPRRPGRMEVEFLLYECRQGEEQLVLPRGESRIRSRRLLHRPADIFTTILLDEETEGTVWGQTPQPLSRAGEGYALAQACRVAAELPKYVSLVNSLPSSPLGLKSIDQFVLASGRMARDHAGLSALRQWLEGGGKMWVMLDLVDPEVLIPLLGDAIDFHVVERISLAKFKIESRPSSGIGLRTQTHEHDRPVEFARVLLPPEESVEHSIDGWPVCFERAVGLGKVVFTTLGLRGFVAGAGVPPFFADRQTPQKGAGIPGKNAGAPAQRKGASAASQWPVLAQVATDLLPLINERTFDVAAFGGLLNDDIGYAVIGRGRLLLVFAGFFAAAAVAGMMLRRSRRPELVGWLAPAAALGAAGMVLALAQLDRQAATPTTAVAQIVQPVSGTNEAAVHGLLAACRTESGPGEAGASPEVFFELDMSGTDGQIRRLIWNGLDGWRWDNLRLPAGIRLAPFTATLRTPAPITAVARIGPNGLEGKLTAQPFTELTDAVLHRRNGRDLAVHIQKDGTFASSQEDVLALGQFLPGTVLSDRQQRRQDLYREFLKFPSEQANREVLLAWAKPAAMDIKLADGAPQTGAALLMVPLQMERSARGQRVRLPGPLVTCRKAGVRNQAIAVAREGGMDADMKLLFLVPAAVLPLKIEQARLQARIRAPGRRLVIAAPQDIGSAELYRAESPADAFHLDLTDDRLLRLDQDGRLHLDLSLHSPEQIREQTPEQITQSVREGNRPQNWRIDYLELEVAGRTE
jgi:hypothetical protein